LLSIHPLFPSALQTIVTDASPLLHGKPRYILLATHDDFHNKQLLKSRSKDMGKINELADPDLIQTLIIPWAIKIGVALAIFIIGRWIAKWLTGVVRKLMAKSNMDDMLIQFLGNIVYTILLLVVVMAALDHIGIQTTSLLAVFGAAGLAIVWPSKIRWATFPQVSC
jgi:small-conductance mechanosensitive channel